jgi:arsenate reductase
MAEGWARALCADSIDAHSAGIEAHGQNLDAIAVMAEAGVDISTQTSKTLDTFDDSSFDFVITVCDHANESCPVFPGSTRVLHAGFDDAPKLAAAVQGREAKLDCYRRVRDAIRGYVAALPTTLI